MSRYALKKPLLKVPAVLLALVILMPTAGVNAVEGEDRDGDGVEDVADNCLEIQNPSQLDVDEDGFGNACDLDFNNDGDSDEEDLGTWIDCFGQVKLNGRRRKKGDDPSCRESDLNGDSAVGLAGDYELVVAQLDRGVPGPAAADANFDGEPDPEQPEEPMADPPVDPELPAELRTVFETSFEELVVDGHQILEASGQDSPIKFSSWGRGGENTRDGMRVFVDADESGETPSGHGDLAARCEMSMAQRFLEEPMYTRMELLVPDSWEADLKTHPDLFFQLHGTGVPNLSIRGAGDDLFVDIRYKSTDWRTAERSRAVRLGPGRYVFEIEWLATKQDHGYFRVWVNGEHLVTHNGPTMYQDEQKAGLRHQFGLYKDDWTTTDERQESVDAGITRREYFVTDFGAYLDERR